MSLIPVTIITGFLGAGKTTLLNRILRDNTHKQKIAVIENEFGEESIDSGLLVQSDVENIVQMNNGCICCSIRGDLVTALVKLSDKRRKGEIDFERVVIETTGLADPGPITQTFFVEDNVAIDFMIDGVITLVDAVHAMDQLDEFDEAKAQVGFADRILISKADLSTPYNIDLLIERLKRMNPHAFIHLVDFGNINIKEVLDIKGFNLSSQIDLNDEHHHHDHHEHGHDHACCCGHCHCHEHHEDECHNHLDNINSFVFKTTKAFDPEKLNVFFDEMIEHFGTQMLRYKGVLNMAGTDHKVVFQGVHTLIGTDVLEKWAPDEVRESRLVFIGKQLPKDIFIHGLQQTLKN